MLIKTHLVITVFFILLLISAVEHKLIFVVVALLATYIPDIDSRYSTLGRKRINRILQWFTRHRGMIHSFTFLLTITLFLVLFWPIIALGFFLGYGLHLFADSFTVSGIRPFYPYKGKSCGGIKTGGVVEKGIFMFFIVASFVLLVLKISNIF